MPWIVTSFLSSKRFLTRGEPELCYGLVVPELEANVVLILWLLLGYFVVICSAFFVSPVCTCVCVCTIRYTRKNFFP